MHLGPYAFFTFATSLQTGNDSMRAAFDKATLISSEDAFARCILEQDGVAFSYYETFPLDNARYFAEARRCVFTILGQSLGVAQEAMATTKHGQLTGRLSAE